MSESPVTKRAAARKAARKRSSPVVPLEENAARLFADLSATWPRFCELLVEREKVITPLQALRMEQVVAFVRKQIGGRYPGVSATKGGSLGLWWNTASCSLFVEIEGAGRMHWEWNNELLFAPESMEGCGWCDHFELCVCRVGAAIEAHRC